MEIKEIKKRFEALKKLQNADVILISELAKELQVRDTDLMLFIEENPKLFETEYKYSPRKEQHVRSTLPLHGGENIITPSTLLGLGLKAVYLSPKENINTEEGAQHKKELYSKYIYISQFNNYRGIIQGYYIEEDKPGSDKDRCYIWRNTKEKIEELIKLGVLRHGIFTFAEEDYCPKWEKDYVISKRGLEIIKGKGWSFNTISPIGSISRGISYI